MKVTTTTNSYKITIDEKKNAIIRANVTRDCGIDCIIVPITEEWNTQNGPDRLSLTIIWRRAVKCEPFIASVLLSCFPNGLQRCNHNIILMIMFTSQGEWET
jgi:hypothetical protein